MTNQNIEIGIDLGTTNSSVAIIRNSNIEIVKKPGGVEYTPSIFGFDKAKNKVVGQKAYEALYRDASDEEVNNYRPEVKRVMGTPENFYFERADVEMNAEEISAEILKNLKEDILRKYPDFNTLAAVITIPAAFSVLQSEATKRAGNLAGFKHVVLLQEPIAAAISYGFSNSKNENWLIYDLGGGTFDVALISSKDGVLSVLSHNGDNFLGGKNFDWEIVDQVITPRILNEFSLKDFSRENKKYRGVFSRLKYIAEKAKIELSQYEKTLIELDSLSKDDEGKDICLTLQFTRNEFEKLIESMVERTIELSKDTLKEAGIKNSAVSKVILVGGPTQMPYIKQRLAKELMIEVNATVDPLTVVARGALIYALGQKIPREVLEENASPLSKGTQKLNLNYDSLTSETEETVTGIIDEFKDSEEEYYVQIQSNSGLYNGSKIKLKAGKFLDTVALETNKSNLFWIYLFDKQGNTVPVDPDSFTITHGLSVSGAPIPHSIGVVVSQKDIKSGFVATEVFVKLIEKGAVLPVKKSETFKTAHRLKKDEDSSPLWIRVGEGESEIPDRNAFVCELGIKGSALPYDLPEGTDVELTIEVSESRELFVTAYIPLIDLTINARSTFLDELVDVSDVSAELDVQTQRASTVSESCSADEKNKINNTIQSVSSSLKNAHLDKDEKSKANKQLRDLKNMLDLLEKEKEMPQMSKEFEENIENTEKIIDEFGDDNDKAEHEEQMAQMKIEGEKAIVENDKTLLIMVNQQIKELAAKVLFSNPAAWVYQFRQLISSSNKWINEKEARYYTDKGLRAIELSDVEELKRCVHQLLLLLPSDAQRSLKNNLSGITR
ncbi:Hsp70 family protein [Candidatus Woesebacteria bacterium]|nr:Hsp70 family protein [Candidatus Woesebacteria bacterium]